MASTGFRILSDEETIPYGRRIATTQECPAKLSKPRYVVLMGMMILDKTDRALVITSYDRSFFINEPMIPYIIVKNPYQALDQLRGHVESLLKIYYPTMTIPIKISGIPPRFIEFATYRKDGLLLKSDKLFKRSKMGRAIHHQPIFVQMILVTAYIVPRNVKWPQYWSKVKGAIPYEIQAKGEKMLEFYGIKNQKLQIELAHAGARVKDRQDIFNEYTVRDSYYNYRYIERILRYLSTIEVEFVHNILQIEFEMTYEREYSKSVDLEESEKRTKRTIMIKKPKVVMWIIKGRDRLYSEYDETTFLDVFPCQKVQPYEDYLEVSMKVLQSTRLDPLIIVEPENPLIVPILGQKSLFDLAIFSARYMMNIGSHPIIRPRRRLHEDFQVEVDNIQPEFLQCTIGRSILRVL